MILPEQEITPSQLALIILIWIGTFGGLGWYARGLCDRQTLISSFADGYQYRINYEHGEK